MARPGLSLRAPLPPATTPRASLRGHLEILRIDHWFKNVFVIPGVVVALGTGPDVRATALAWRIALGLLALGLVASSNYVINEVEDAPYDIHHPLKRDRPVPAGRVNLRLAYAQWLGVAATGLALGTAISWAFVATLGALFVQGCVYNLPPVRTKDLAYLDILSEAVNNPLRMLAGWFMVTSSTVPPMSLLVGYWMIGCYFMAIKRFAERRELSGPAPAAGYRKSFGYYTSQRLLVAITFFGSAAMLFFGAFIVRYRFELALAFPLVAIIMAIYLNLGFRPNSPAEHPEKLYREPVLMATVIVCAVLMTVLVFADLPWVRDLFTPSIDPQ